MGVDLRTIKRTSEEFGLTLLTKAEWDNPGFLDRLPSDSALEVPDLSAVDPLTLDTGYQPGYPSPDHDQSEADMDPLSSPLPPLDVERILDYPDHNSANTSVTDNISMVESWLKGCESFNEDLLSYYGEVGDNSGSADNAEPNDLLNELLENTAAKDEVNNSTDVVKSSTPVVEARLPEDRQVADRSKTLSPGYRLRDRGQKRRWDGESLCDQKVTVSVADSSSRQVIAGNVASKLLKVKLDKSCQPTQLQNQSVTRSRLSTPAQSWDSPEQGERKSAAVQARINRQKKKAYIGGLEGKVSDLSKENQNLSALAKKLQHDKQSLEEEVQYLHNVLANESTLSKLLGNINTTNISLSSSFANDRQCSISDLDHDYGKPSKRRPESSGGICIHVDKNKVSMELCSKCALMAGGVPRSDVL